MDAARWVACPTTAVSHRETASMLGSPLRRAKRGVVAAVLALDRQILAALGVVLHLAQDWLHAGSFSTAATKKAGLTKP